MSRSVGPLTYTDALYLGERLGVVKFAGGVLIFACIVSVQVLPQFQRGLRPVRS